MEPRLDNETLLDNCSPDAPKSQFAPPPPPLLSSAGELLGLAGGRGTAEKSCMLGWEIGDDRTQLGRFFSSFPKNQRGFQIKAGWLYFRGDDVRRSIRLLTLSLTLLYI